jgi:hypothetical protein
MNPEYYCLCVVLPGRTTTRGWYPCCAMYARRRDDTAFTSSLQADDKCATLVPGLHRPGLARGWNARAELRASLPRSLDSFEPRPCALGDVRVSSPFLPHGSTAMPDGDRVRRTMEPRLVAVRDNHMWRS